MFQHPHYMMVMVTDMQRSVAFYRDVLGLTLRFESPGWSEFSTGPTTLVLHGWGDPEPVPHLTELPARPTAGTCSFGFYVSDLQAAFAELVARGVKVLKPPTNLEDFGFWAAIVLDPDGTTISLAQKV
ncbi:hypothetical protein DYH09_30105 [bacterium CPR1]|jgi:lactoylglutathione lyase|nr:hypothetical protein [bacterium CPR1]